MNSPSQTHMNAVQMTHRLVRSGHTFFFKTTSLLEARGVYVPKQNAIVATVVVTYSRAGDTYCAGKLPPMYAGLKE